VGKGGQPGDTAVSEELAKALYIGTSKRIQETITAGKQGECTTSGSRQRRLWRGGIYCAGSDGKISGMDKKAQKRRDAKKRRKKSHRKEPCGTRPSTSQPGRTKDVANTPAPTLRDQTGKKS